MQKCLNVVRKMGVWAEMKLTINFMWPYRGYNLWEAASMYSYTVRRHRKWVAMHIVCTTSVCSYEILSVR